MRISCPNCSATYEVPDSALAAGPRLLRCARCAHQFQAALPEPVPPEAPPPEAPPPEAPPPEAPPPEPAPAPEPLTPVEDPAPRNRNPLPAPEASVGSRLANAPTSKADRFALAGWLLTLAVLGVAGYAVVAWRADITGAWPPAQRLYSAIGLG